MASEQVFTPEVTWAERSSDSDAAKNFIWITFVVADVAKEDLKLDIQPKSISFSGVSSRNGQKKKYEVELPLWGEVDPQASTVNHTANHVGVKLQKKDLDAKFWKRLLADDKKRHFLKTDFDRWVDEDEQNEAEEDLSQFGGMGMPGMGGMGGGDFGGIDFSKLGGGPGAGEDSDEDLPSDEEDEGMPALEDDDSAKKADGGDRVVDVTETEDTKA